MAVIDDNGKVLNIISCSDDELETKNLLAYTQQNPAYIQGDFVDGFFYAPQPFLSWTRNNGLWIPPVPRPTSEGVWLWNEEDQEWQD